MEQEYNFVKKQFNKLLKFELSGKDITIELKEIFSYVKSN